MFIKLVHHILLLRPWSMDYLTYFVYDVSESFKTTFDTMKAAYKLLKNFRIIITEGSVVVHRAELQS